MEDVEKRRQRLAAMREQAAMQADNIAPSLGPSLLPSNPLDDGEADFVPPGVDMKGSRFDFYTDPLAGYAGTKRRKPGSTALEAQTTLPSQTNAVYQAQPGAFHPPLEPAVLCPPMGPPAWQPIPYQAPSGMPGYVQQPQVPPGQYYPPPGPPPHASQFFNPPQGRGFSRGQGFMGGGREPSSGPGQGSGAFAGGRGRRGDGRGHLANDGHGGRRFSSSGRHGGGQSRGTGRGPVSAQSQPHLFFKKSMVEDPWQHLESG